MHHEHMAFDFKARVDALAQKEILTPLEEGSDTGIWQRIASLLKFRHRKKPSQPDLQREIKQLIDVGEEEGLLSEDEGDMIESILSFRDTLAREIMVPRPDAVIISADTPIEMLLQLVIQEGHSRFPVHDGSIDNIIGVLHVKDLLSFWSQEHLNLKDILRTPYFIPETKKISHLLRELRDKKSHMAIVIDEYGGTAGLVTIEDIIEEIIGEIHDEYDNDDILMVPTAEGDLVVDARLEIEKLLEHFSLEVPKGNFESVGGFIISLLGRVPQPHETITHAPLEMTIESADARKIRKVRVRVLEEEVKPDISPADT
ncbi:MAG: hemolysin family protein [Deltaproteobacteria bacterium]|nr:hemolysin family protein [Deltaproteobacteria bacterium]